MSRENPDKFFVVYDGVNNPAPGYAAIPTLSKRECLPIGIMIGMPILKIDDSAFHETWYLVIGIHKGLPM